MIKKVNLTTTFAQLKSAGACEEGYKKLAKSLGGITKYGKTTPISMVQVLESNGVDDCLWSLRAVEHPDRDRIARYIACDCAEAVLWIYEKFNTTDKRPHEAIRVARLFADGKATQEELAAAGAAARDAARDAAGAAAGAAARAAAGAAAGAARAAWAAWAAARDAQKVIILQYIC